MLTAFGKELRKIRIDNNELLKDMSRKLGVTVSYLSAVENGKREIPESWLDSLAILYDLDSGETEKLFQLAYESKKEMKLNLSGAGSGQRRMAMTFARSFMDLDEDDIKAITYICNRKNGGE